MIELIKGVHVKIDEEYLPVLEVVKTVQPLHTMVFCRIMLATLPSTSVNICCPLPSACNSLSRSHSHRCCTFFDLPIEIEVSSVGMISPCPSSSTSENYF
jgi:uncharacterized membrane protein YkvI